ncbi:MAG: hypothetical protein K0S71_765 [Clostridia bacterium]|jgi:hypothetical protein|nr:hypothetical protein [Clostridia bacterium]
MSGFNGCYGSNIFSGYDCGPSSDNSYKGSWLLPALLIFAAVLFSGSISWLLILLGIFLFFGKELLEFIF